MEPKPKDDDSDHCGADEPVVVEPEKPFPPGYDADVVNFVASSGLPGGTVGAITGQTVMTFRRPYEPISRDSGYERFTDRARRVMQLANQEAQRCNHVEVEPEHILIGLVKEGSGVAAAVLNNLDIDLRKIRTEVEKFLGAGPDVVTMGKMPLTERSKGVRLRAVDAANGLKHNYVGTEHILLGVLADDRCGELLKRCGVTAGAVREEILCLLAPADAEGVPAKEAFARVKEQIRQKADSPTKWDVGVEAARTMERCGVDPAMAANTVRSTLASDDTPKQPPYSFIANENGYSYTITFRTHAELMAFVKVAMPQVFKENR